jgi:hypothetical protein
MPGIGTIKLAGLAVALLCVFLVLRWIYKQGKNTGAKEAINDESKQVIKAENELAEKLYDDNPNRTASGVRKPDAWKKPPPQA